MRVRQRDEAHFYVIAPLFGWTWFPNDTNPIVQFVAHAFFFGTVLVSGSIACGPAVERVLAGPLILGDQLARRESEAATASAPAAAAAATTASRWVLSHHCQLVSEATSSKRPCAAWRPSTGS